MPESTSRVEAVANELLRAIPGMHPETAPRFAAELLAVADRAALADADGVVRRLIHYTTAYDSLHRDLADDLRQAAATIQAMAGLLKPSARALRLVIANRPANDHAPTNIALGSLAKQIEALLANAPPAKRRG